MKYLIIIIGAVILFAAPLLHIDFPRKNEIVEKEKDFYYSKLVKPVEDDIIDNRKKYDDNIITAEGYIIANDHLEEKLLKLESEYKKESNKITDEHRVFGWKTYRFFLVGFGIRLPYLLFSIIISLLILAIDTDDQLLKRCFIFLQISMYTISLYVIVWCFWYSQDYPLEAYRYAIIGIIGLVSTCTAYFLSYKSRYRDKLVLIIRSQFSFIYKLDKEGYIVDEKLDEFTKEKIELVEKAVKNE